MRQNSLSIHSENILPIIKKWLYSDKDIFIRELVSNATDALNKVKVLKEAGEAVRGAEEYEIQISIDKEAKTITIADTGIGMTEEEVEKYIAQIAFSGAEEFAAKYQSQTEKDPIIGHFGLGFYSAYMVAAKVEIQTVSYRADATPVFWSCDGSSSYTIGQGTKSSRGTEIILHLNEDNLEYLEEEKLESLLERYCSFMPFPISLNEKGIDNKPPLWMKAPSECSDADYKEFYSRLFPTDASPLFWVHLNVDYPFNLKGILYFPRTNKRYDAKEAAIKLFCNRVFVSEHCNEFLPDYLMILKGAIDSPDIPLNVSRSYLQVDQNVKQLSSHIAKKVADRLTVFLRQDREKYIEAWGEIELFLKLGILRDEKFYDRAKDLLIWKNSLDEWTTATDYLERSKSKKIYYALSEQSTPILQMYKDKKIEVLFSSSYVDTGLIPFIESKMECTFSRIDGGLNEALLDPEKETTLLDSDRKTLSARLASFFAQAIGDAQIQVEAKSLASDQIPAVLLLDEKQRRMRDYIQLTIGKTDDVLQPKKTFVVNTNSKLIQAIEKLQGTKPEIAKDLAQGIYNLSLISGREIQPEAIDRIMTQQSSILEKLASLLV
jgi:molecular chaperone HtpG